MFSGESAETNEQKNSSTETHIGYAFKEGVEQFAVVVDKHPVVGRLLEPDPVARP